MKKEKIEYLESELEVLREAIALNFKTIEEYKAIVEKQKRIIKELRNEKHKRDNPNHE